MCTNLLQNSDNQPPKSLDFLEFDFEGVTFRCFCILHGITVGLNNDYREIIKQSIREIQDIRLVEKRMKLLYRIVALVMVTSIISKHAEKYGSTFIC